jgi:uncharacterized protein
MINRKRIGLDIDGTITCPSSFIPYINKSFNKNLTLNDLTEYELHPQLNITKDEFWEWMNKHEETIYRDSPIAQFFDIVYKDWLDHHFIFISARREQFLEVTQEWLNKHDIPYNHVELIGSHHKVEAVKKLQCDIFFEDKHDNACDIAEQCGIPVILFGTPYNNKPVPNGVIRVKDWKEAKVWVDSWLKK